jgi:hypothetical protein
MTWRDTTWAIGVPAAVGAIRDRHGIEISVTPIQAG